MAVSKKSEEEIPTVTWKIFTFYKPRFWPVFITAVAVLMCVGLGVWQLQRLQWKEGLIEKLDSSRDMGVVSKGKLPEDLNDLREKQFQTVTLPGHFEHEHEFHLLGQRHKGEQGYDVLTPFRIADDGRMILVNRGWVPLDKKVPEDRKEEDVRFDGIIFLNGMVMAPESGRWFLPDHDIDNNIWLFYDIAKMNEVSGLNLPNVVVDMVNANPVEGHLPIPRESSYINLRNDHLNYAFIWFSLAFSGLVIFFIYHLKSVEGDEDDDDQPAKPKGA